MELNLSEVRKQLPSLIDAVVESNDEVVIMRRGRPVARITRFQPAPEERYPLRGLGVWMSDDFDEPMDDLWESSDDD